jgi:hypothetical protein
MFGRFDLGVKYVGHKPPGHEGYADTTGHATLVPPPAIGNIAASPVSCALASFSKLLRATFSLFSLIE